MGDLLLPREVQVVAAANPPERAADGWDLTPPLANRFLHIAVHARRRRLDRRHDRRLQFPGHRPRVISPVASGAAIARANVAAFIRTRPALLDAFPTNPTSQRSRVAVAAHLDDDRRRARVARRRRSDAAYLAATGLVGEGAAVEYLTWRREADLPDPALVVADPTSVAWRSLDPSRVWAILAGVVGYSTGKGTIEAWREGWRPLAVAAEMGKGDVAAACARTLLMARPPNARQPLEVRAFIGVLQRCRIDEAA